MKIQKKETHSETIMLRLSPTLLGKVTKVAKEVGINRIDVIRQLIEQGLAQMESSDVDTTS